MKLYVYEPDSMVLVAIVNGDSNEMCEALVADRFDDEQYLSTYTPAFGAEGGVVWSEESEVIDADGGV